MQIIRFVKSLVIGGIFFSMLLSIATINEKMQKMQNDKIQTVKHTILDLNEKDSLEIVLQNPIKVVTCIVLEKQEDEIISLFPIADIVQKPTSYISFSIFHPPKFS